MSDSQIQPKIYYTVDAPISAVVSENGRLKVVDGEIESIDGQQRLVVIRDTTNIKKTVKIENIKKLNLDEKFYESALIVSKFHNNGSGYFTIHDPNDTGNDLSKPPQQPQQPQQPQNPVFPSLGSLITIDPYGTAFIDANYIIYGLVPSIRGGGSTYQAPADIRPVKKDQILPPPTQILIDLTSTQE